MGLPPPAVQGPQAQADTGGRRARTHAGTRTDTHLRTHGPGPPDPPRPGSAQRRATAGEGGRRRVPGAGKRRPRIQRQGKQRTRAASAARPSAAPAKHGSWRRPPAQQPCASPLPTTAAAPTAPWGTGTRPPRLIREELEALAAAAAALETPLCSAVNTCVVMDGDQVRGAACGAAERRRVLTRAVAGLGRPPGARPASPAIPAPPCTG